MIALLRRYLRRYRGSLVLVVVLLLVQAIGTLYLPSLNADIINNGVVVGDTAYIVRVGALMLIVTVLLGVSTVVSVYFSARAAMGFGRDVRGAVFRRVQGFSLREVNEFGVPSLITRTTNDVQQVQLLVLMGLTMMVSAPIMAAGGIVMAVRENVQLSSLLVVVVPVMLAVIGVLVRQAVPLFRAMQVKVDRINQVMRENLAGIRVIRAFVRTRHEQERFAEANDDLTATALRVNRLFALTFPSLMLILNLSSVAIVWFGGHLIDSGAMPIGNLTAFLAYIMQILFSVMMAVMMVVMVPRAAASAERIQAVLATTPAIGDPSHAAGEGEPPEPAGDDARGRGRVELRGVEFRYPGAQDAVLRDVNLTLLPGQVTAITGSTGSGKTTLVNLLPRLYDVTAGAVLLDGVDVRDLPLESLWARIGLVPQKSFLFSGTVADNVRLGRHEASDDDVWQALEVAQARDFVAAMPDGLDAPIDQGGANVSGGQRQRLAIARALAKRPDVYIFDDSFSALDYATDARLRAALTAQTGQATVLIVAQRVSTIMRADRIVVLDQGSVVGEGSHAELMATCETYREIVTSQLDQEEAA